MSEDWFQVEQVSSAITRIWEPNVHRMFRANIFHIVGRDADLVVDFGNGVCSLSRALDLRAGKPVIAVATHSHVDHVGSFHEFEHRLGHPLEAAVFRTMDEGRTLAGAFRDGEHSLARLPHEGWDQTAYALEPAPLSSTIDEGSRIDIGSVSYTVLHLPGHSPGSIGLFDETSGIFVAGDAIYEGQLVDNLQGSDKAQYLQTMRRLSDFAAGEVHGGHNQMMSGKRMNAIAKQYVETLEAPGSVPGIPSSSDTS